VQGGVLIRAGGRDTIAVGETACELRRITLRAAGRAVEV
jgi:hypothetical protein